ncbi:phage head closure protein [Pseudomonas fluorescens]|uniref:phage head closure protein n=1 Tax=Pseudomonas fluorescens TaxID=294 RepID=UPI001241DBDE|nr:phage head closure protein [Pseudomonas fluorescens]
MRAGPLRHRVEIQQKVSVRDTATGEYGEPTWQTFATVWASKTDLSTRDVLAAKAGQSEVTSRFVIRYRAGVLPTMRIVHRGEVYSIEGPPMEDPKSGREYLTILVSKGVKDG